MARVRVKSPEERDFRVCDIPVGGCFRLVGGQTRGKVYRTLQKDIQCGDNAYISYSLCWSYDDDKLVKFFYSSKSRRVLPVEITDAAFVDLFAVAQPDAGEDIDYVEASRDSRR